MVYAEVPAITADMSLPVMESLDDLIQLSADLATKVNVACGPHEPATAADGGQEVRRPRHASSSSDISSEGRSYQPEEGNKFKIGGGTKRYCFEISYQVRYQGEGKLSFFRGAGGLRGGGNLLLDRNIHPLLQLYCSLHKKSTDQR